MTSSDHSLKCIYIAKKIMYKYFQHLSCNLISFINNFASLSPHRPVVCAKRTRATRKLNDKLKIFCLTPTCIQYMTVYSVSQSLFNTLRYIFSEIYCLHLYTTTKINIFLLKKHVKTAVTRCKM